NFGTPGVMFGAEISGVLPIYTFGKLSALEDLAANGLEVGKGLMERAQAEAELQAAQAYWSYQFARQGRGEIAETLGRIDDAKKVLLRLREQKSTQVTQMDVYKLEFYRNAAEARLSAADSGAALSLAAVRLLTATPPNVKVGLSKEDLPQPS